MPDGALAIGIAGLGNIGLDVARWLVGSAPRQLRLAAAAGRDVDAVAAKLAALGAQARAVALPELIDHCDVLVDCTDDMPEILAALNLIGSYPDDQLYARLVLPRGGVADKKMRCSKRKRIS